MKKFTLIAILAIAYFNGFSQKVDLDRSYAPTSYHDLPEKPLGMDYKTYNVDPKITALIARYIPREEVASKFFIEGFKKTDSIGDLTLKLYVDDIQITRTEVKTREEVVKDKAGNVTSRKYYYREEIDYNLQSKSDLVDNKAQKVIDSRRLDERSTNYTYKSSEFDSYSAARDFYNSNRDMIIGQLIKNRIDGYANDLKQALSKLYGYPLRKENVLLWIEGGKKHPEFEAYAKIDNIMKEGFAALTADASVDHAKEVFQPAIEYLNDLLKRYTKDEKGDKKMRYSAYFNLMQIYYYLDMPDEAAKNAEALIVNDYDTRDGKYMLKYVADLKAMFAKNNFNTRHFDRGL